MNSWTERTLLKKRWGYLCEAVAFGVKHLFVPFAWVWWEDGESGEECNAWRYDVDGIVVNPDLLSTVAATIRYRFIAMGGGPGTVETFRVDGEKAKGVNCFDWRESVAIRTMVRLMERDGGGVGLPVDSVGDDRNAAQRYDIPRMNATIWLGISLFSWTEGPADLCPRWWIRRPGFLKTAIKHKKRHDELVRQRKIMKGFVNFDQVA